jgi:L-fuculose-phosphate aldolase
MLMLARSLGPIHYVSEGHERELLNLKQEWGYADPRNTPEYKNCDVCANDIFRDSWKEADVAHRAFQPPPPMGGAPGDTRTTEDQEALIQAITDRVMAALQSD